MRVAVVTDMIREYGTPYTPYSKWAKRFDYIIKYLKRYEFDLDVRFTPRYLFYRLIDAGVMSLEKNMAKKFSEALTRAKKDFKNNKYDIIREMVIDDSRPILEQVFRRDEYSKENILRKLKNVFTFKSRLYPYDTWVELWFEKNTVFKMYKHISEKYRLFATSLRGNLTPDMVYAAKQRFLKAIDQGMYITILYIGDFNPSGDHRPDLIQTVMESLGHGLGSCVTVFKVLVNEKHMERYNLLENLDELEKLKRDAKAKKDPNVERFVKKYGKVYNVNVEAMEIETVRELIEDAIDGIVDVSKLEETKREETTRIPVDVEKVSDTEFIVRMLP